MPVFGYAEDALTYWALTQRTAEILRQLEDDSDRMLRVYRPSFGRGGSPRVFGEMDGILESKWEGPVRRRRPREEIKLGGSQTLRHEIFHWYFNAWLAECSKTWGDFLASREAEFRREFPGKEMVRKEPGERLGANLEAL